VDSRDTPRSGLLDEKLAAAVERGDGSDLVHGLDLRSPEAARRRTQGGPSLDAAGHCRGKKKNDRIDANKICDGLRCDFLPECYMAPTAVRERRRTLRYRNLLVRQMVQMKIKISALLMEAGVSYKTEAALIGSLQHDRLLVERVERLMSIPAIGPITALIWALEIGEVQRFSSIKKAISYCGLCGDEKSSGDTVRRTPLSKQRNKHLQTTLIEVAKMAPRYSPTLALLYDREKQKGNANRATLAVARKLVAYLMAVDRGQTHFLVIERETRTALESGLRNKVFSARGLPGLAFKPTGHESASSRCSR
jgi:Transposase IS116/IS110/IS902 family